MRVRSVVSIDSGTNAVKRFLVVLEMPNDLVASTNVPEVCAECHFYSYFQLYVNFIE